MEETNTETQKNTRTGSIWAVILLILLLGLTALYLIDRYRTHKQLVELSYDKDTLKTVNLKLKEQYSATNNSYNELLSKYNSLLDTALLQSGVLDEKKKEMIKLQELLNKQDSIVSSINKVVQDALFGFRADELQIETKNGKLYITMLDKLLFASGSAEVQTKGVGALKKLAEVLNNNKDINIEIEGHTDIDPIKTDKYQDNWDLSVARATTIVRILTQDYSVDAKRITASGRAEFYPVAPNTNKDGKAKNRRTEIMLSPDLEELYNLIGTKSTSK